MSEKKTRKLILGVTDLWTTHPHIAKLLLNPDDGYTVTYGSSKKLDWKCPDCGTPIRQKIVHNVVRHGLSCTLCANTRSIGHRIINSILNELKIDYVCEKSFIWSERKSYDVYIDNPKCIIEINGIQHYEECGLNKLGNNTLQDQIENDNYKCALALNNGIEKYIYIDARESSIEYIVNSIKNNKQFNSLFDISHINWETVLYNALDSDICKIRDLFNSGKTVTEICKITHYSDSVISRKLHDLTAFGFCNYTGVDEKNKPVICLNTREVFINLNEAGKKYNINPNGISHCCKGLRNRKTAGKLPDGTKLMWLFKEDYDKKTEAEIEEILNSKNKKKVGASKVICLNTLEIFDSIKLARSKYPTAKSITDCCRHICRSSGIDKNGNKLKWLYYDEYILLTEEEINEILQDVDYDDKRIVCLNTCAVFENEVVAGKWCGVLGTGISQCVLGHYKYNGKHPETGEELRWAKYKDYIKEHELSTLTLFDESTFLME